MELTTLYRPVGQRGYDLIAASGFRRFPTVGSSLHQEYWIPAGELEDFNDRISGPIHMIACFRDGGPTPSRSIIAKTGLVDRGSIACSRPQ